jgi:hypothetical protein
MNTFTRDSLRALDRDIEAALAAVAAKHGVALKLAGTRFTAQNATIKIEAAVINAAGEAETRAAQDFKQLAGLYGFAASDLGREVILDGRRLKIAGLRPKADKRPILLQDANGGMIVAPAEYVRRMMEPS